MVSFAALSLRHKILSIALIGAIGFLSYLAHTYSTANLNDQRLSKIQQVNFPILDRIGKSWLRLSAAKSNMQTAIGENELELIAKAKAEQEALNEMLEEIATLEPGYADEMSALTESFEQYMDSSEGLARAMMDGSAGFEQLAQSAQKMNSLYSSFTQDLQSFRDKAYNDFALGLQQAKDESLNAVVTGITIGMVVIFVLIATAWLISNSITTNINLIIKNLSSMATGKGDLTVRLSTSAKDEVGELVNQFNAFITHLQLMVKVLANLAKGVTERTDEVGEIALRTKTGILDQQSEIHQVAAAVTEMAQTAHEVAKNAHEASKSTDQADRESQNGQQVVQKNVVVITDLTNEIESARQVIQNLAGEIQQISSASQDILSIAEQTNLLALNAAIEAARAGEQGRGFAVVADEVRTLAARTGQSTKDISDIINRLLTGAKQAVEVMERSRERALSSATQSRTTGESLNSILEAVNAINEMNILVASSAEEQSAVAEEVSINISRINDVSDNTANEAKATANAASALSEQANQLQSIVNEFRV